MRPNLVFLVLALGTAACAPSCSGTAVQRHSATADLTASGWNQLGEPALVRAFERDQMAALDDVCPRDAGPCDFTSANAAVEGVRARWAPFWTLTEQVRGDHDAWRLQLEACRRSAEAGTCSPRVDALAGLFWDRATQWRCTLRALGHGELDKMPGTPTCTNGANDGGRD